MRGHTRPSRTLSGLSNVRAQQATRLYEGMSKERAHQASRISVKKWAHRGRTRQPKFLWKTWAKRGHTKKPKLLSRSEHREGAPGNPNFCQRSEQREGALASLFLWRIEQWNGCIASPNTIKKCAMRGLISNPESFPIIEQWEGAISKEKFIARFQLGYRDRSSYINYIDSQLNLKGTDDYL